MDFLSDGKRPYLIIWNHVYKNKENEVWVLERWLEPWLMGKWLWRSPIEGSTLWIKEIKSKFDIFRRAGSNIHFTNATHAPPKFNISTPMYSFSYTACNGSILDAASMMILFPLTRFSKIFNLHTPKSGITSDIYHDSSSIGSNST